MFRLYITHCTAYSSLLYHTALSLYNYYNSDLLITIYSVLEYIYICIPDIIVNPWLYTDPCSLVDLNLGELTTSSTPPPSHSTGLAELDGSVGASSVFDSDLAALGEWHCCCMYSCGLNMSLRFENHYFSICFLFVMVLQ